MRLASTVVAGSLMLVVCADPASPGDQASVNGPLAVIPDVAQVVCETDGAIRLLEPSIRAQPDGLHIRVDVSLDEPVQLSGPWMDEPLPPGTTNVVTVNPPGMLTLACWPISQLESSSFEPERVELEILDPEGIYVSEELECLPGDEPGAWTSDYGARGPDIEPPITPAQAEAVLDGLAPGDLVTFTGYPERPGERIAVTRDGRTIASMLFSHEPDGIDSHAGEICWRGAVLPPVIQEEMEHG
jgi:hypothetical protein